MSIPEMLIEVSDYEAHYCPIDFKIVRKESCPTCGLLQENKRLKERLQVELRASNVRAYEKYPKTDYFAKL